MSLTDTVQTSWKAASWNNTGGDVRVHLIPADHPTTPVGEPWSLPFSVATPKCGLGIYHGGWTQRDTSSMCPPYRLCDRCFP